MGGLQRTIIADPNAALAQARQLVASDPAAAEAQARLLLGSYPDNPATLRLLGQALRRLDRRDEAARTEQQALAVSGQSPAHQAAASALQSGDTRQAMGILQQLLSDDSNDVLALTMLGLHWMRQNQFQMAETLLRRAVDQAPDDAATRMALAELLVRSKRATLALEELDGITAADEQSEQLMSLRAECMSALGRIEEELAILAPMVARGDPRDVGFALRTGHAHRSLGRDGEAAATYRAILARDPAEGTSWWSLANLKAERFDEADITAMQQALTLPDNQVQNRIRLNFALGRAFEQQRDPAAAYRHFAEGNRLRDSISPYDPLVVSEWIERNERYYVPRFYAARAGLGAPDRDPIFIVGMQRSGSTLVEQILASHSAIEGTAELAEMPNLVRELGETAAHHNQSFERYVAGLPADRLRALGETYLTASRVHRRTDRPLFTDKMPNNWMHVGLIRLILPNARIVDVRRDPMACCFSNWKQLYARGLDHSNALDTMGRFYADYIRLMRHFDGVQPGAIHRIIYDDLVEDLEGGVRRLLDYLDLPFDPACLDFHSNARAVQTISATQVRKPINRDGMNQWQPYDQWLGPLRDALGDTLDTWRH